MSRGTWTRIPGAAVLLGSLVAGLPAAPDMPAGPGAPGVPGGSEAPWVPGGPGAASGPGRPGAPGGPGGPSAPGVPGGETGGRVTVSRAPAGSAIPGRYIIRLRPGGLAADVIIPTGVRPLYVYQSVFNGFAATLTPEQVNEVLGHPEVAAVEEDGLVRAFGDHPPTPQAPDHGAPAAWRDRGGPGAGRGAGGGGPAVPWAAGRGAPTLSWGLDRIDQRRLPLDHSFTVAHDGTGITAYILDSGISASRAEFTGRLTPGYSVIKDGKGTTDCLGHGTFVAGIVGGATWGVARNIHLAPVRVLDCKGAGAFSGIIAGLDWVAKNAIRPAVANASLGGAKSPAVNEAANELTRSGVFLAAAAGNSFGDACEVSPAGAPAVLTIAASTITDTPAEFSNTGPCVDLFAPGLDIISATPGTTAPGTKTGDGTSYAAPFVTGVAALYKQAHGDTPTATLQNWLVDNATTTLTAVPADTPDRLLYTNGL
ncbi:S8 family peptidase [Sphaerisporangium corydalis]|nr:S8 family peptidase [Sphaerisporangium corydalis]